MHDPNSTGAQSGPRLREAVSGLPAYKAGKAPAPGEGPSYKLASNENPYPPLPGVLEAASAAAGSINRYLASRMDQWPLKTSVWKGSTSACSRRISAWTRPRASTT